MADEWAIIVDQMPRQEADAALRKWLELHRSEGRTVSEDDIRNDTIRAVGGKVLIRYLIRQGFLDGIQ
jgi:hypothetical protein